MVARRKGSSQFCLTIFLWQWALCQAQDTGEYWVPCARRVRGSRSCFCMLPSTAFFSTFGSSSGALWVVLGESYLNVLTLNMFVKSLGSPTLLLHSKTHIKIRQTYKDILTRKRLVSGRLGRPLISLPNSLKWLSQVIATHFIYMLISFKTHVML